jgi:hypothetical protein
VTVVVGGVSRSVVVDGRPLASGDEQEVILSLFSLLHGAVTVPATTLAIEQSHGVELCNIDDVVVYAQTSKSFMVSCLRALGSGRRLVVPVVDGTRVTEWERRQLLSPEMAAEQMCLMNALRRDFCEPGSWRPPVLWQRKYSVCQKISLTALEDLRSWRLKRCSRS